MIRCIYAIVFYDKFFIICYSDNLTVYLFCIHIYVRSHKNLSGVKEWHLGNLNMSWFSAGETARWVKSLMWTWRLEFESPAPWCLHGVPGAAVCVCMVCLVQQYVSAWCAWCGSVCLSGVADVAVCVYMVYAWCARVWGGERRIPDAPGPASLVYLAVINKRPCSKQGGSWGPKVILWPPYTPLST